MVHVDSCPGDPRSRSRSRSRSAAADRACEYVGPFNIIVSRVAVLAPIACGQLGERLEEKALELEWKWKCCC